MKRDERDATTGRRTLLLLVSGILLLAFGWILTGQSLEAKDSGAQTAAGGSSEKVAVVAGQTITEADLEAAATEPLDQLEMQRLQMESRLAQERQKILVSTLDQLLEEKLVALEAEARGVTPDALVAEEVTAKVQPVTEEDIAAFHQELSQQRQGVPPLERIGPQIRAHLEQERQAEVRQAFLDGLATKHKVEIFLEEPRVEVAAVGPAKGPENAPVTIVEFSDFECPFCGRVVPTLDQIRTNYGDKVRIVFRQFPLQMHPNAQKAAEASLCAHDQGKFWEMHDLMFQEQRQLAVADLQDKASRLGLDMAAFNECLSSGKYAAQVAADMRAGTIAGVTGTPAVFINGRFLNGAQPYEAFAAIIDEELAKAEKKG